jgi:hypothetical protein
VGHGERRRFDTAPTGRVHHKEAVMHRCRICHFDAELDDLVLVIAGGRPVCLRCYCRETGNHRPMPRSLCRALSDTLAALEQA